MAPHEDVTCGLPRTGRPLDVTLVERTGVYGRGVAYSTTDPRHLLNVCAGRW